MDDLYQEELMEIYRNPTHKGTMNDSSVHTYEKNPMCGDEITLHLDVKEGIIKDAKFEGSACAVSVISSELLLEHIIGMPIVEASKISKDELIELLNLNLTTSRVRCATLVLTALKQALALYDRRNTK